MIRIQLCGWSLEFLTVRQGHFLFGSNMAKNDVKSGAAYMASAIRQG